MSTNPSYLQSAADGRVKNLRDWGIPLGRRFRALKLWFLIREQGVARPAGAPAARPRERAVARRRRCAPRRDWRVLAPVPLQTVCVRHEPAGPRRRGARSAHAGVGRARQPLRRGLPDAGDARRALDGARLDRRERPSAMHVEELWSVMRAEAER